MGVKGLESREESRISIWTQYCLSRISSQLFHARVELDTSPIQQARQIHEAIASLYHCLGLFGLHVVDRTKSFLPL